jgi:hypothetical protein
MVRGIGIARHALGGGMQLAVFGAVLRIAANVGSVSIATAQKFRRIDSRRAVRRLRATAVREIARPEVQRLRVLAHGQKDPDVIISRMPSSRMMWRPIWDESSLRRTSLSGRAINSRPPVSPID